MGCPLGEGVYGKGYGEVEPKELTCCGKAKGIDLFR